VSAPDGLLVVDKPSGPTSHDVVAVARRGLGTSRIGHTGTLDPMASGVLVLLVGRATRLARFMSHDVKAYDAEVTFGRATATFDAQGETTERTDRWPAPADLEADLARRVGVQRQTPPAFSAKKFGGKVA
jgi:tRNA pseudouridine55 synthase